MLFQKTSRLCSSFEPIKYIRVLFLYPYRLSIIILACIIWNLWFCRNILQVIQNIHHTGKRKSNISCRPLMFKDFRILKSLIKCRFKYYLTICDAYYIISWASDISDIIWLPLVIILLSTNLMPNRLSEKLQVSFNCLFYFVDEHKFWLRYKD